MGETRGLAPPSSASSASSSALRNSPSVSPPNSAASNSPSGLSDPAQLHQRAGKIVDPMQRERADHEIEARRAERQHLRVGGDRGRRRRAAAESLEPGRRRRPARRPAERRAPATARRACAPRSSAAGNCRSTSSSRSASRSAISACRKSTAAAPRRPLAVQPQGPAIEQWRRLVASAGLQRAPRRGCGLTNRRVV